MSGAQKRNDYSRRFLPFMLMWGIPILVLCSVNVLQHYLPAAPIILMMAGAYIWMGLGCVLNAMKCNRLHCYMSGPTMIIGGLLIGLVGFNLMSLGPIKVMHLSYITLFFVFLSFVPEWINGSYVKNDDTLV